MLVISDRNGYYRYNNQYYYKYDSDWYSYGAVGWYEVPDFPADDYRSFYVGRDFDSDWGTSNFKNSSEYREAQERHSSSSDDYDSWDSSDTDWDSDW